MISRVLQIDVATGGMYEFIPETVNGDLLPKKDGALENSDKFYISVTLRPNRIGRR